jgi:hypothetical protein
LTVPETFDRPPPRARYGTPLDDSRVEAHRLDDHLGLPAVGELLHGETGQRLAPDRLEGGQIGQI